MTHPKGPPLPYEEKLRVAQESRVAKHAAQRKAKVKVNYVTSGGRHSCPEKLAWMRKQRCIVQENRLVLKGTAIPVQTPCGGLVQAHHHRVRGARANDAKTVPLCKHHHTGAPDSLHTLGRRGFEAFHQLDLDAECARKEAEWCEVKSGVGAGVGKDGKGE